MTIRLLVGCLLLWLVSSFLLLGGPAMAQGRPKDKIEPWVLKHTMGAQQAEFLVVLKEQADLTPAARLDTKLLKGAFVFHALLRKAQETQGSLLHWMEERGVAHRSYYIVNLIWAKGDRSLVLELAARADVGRIEGNPWARGVVRGPSPEDLEGPRSLLLGVEPNIVTTQAPAVWALGFTGQGVVVGGQDTGYQWDHPALINQYRGWNGTTASHDYNWHDAIHSGGGACGANSPVPCDDHNHGTHTMGTAVGDDGGSNQIGMAPGARWIGCRNMDQGVGSPATYMECFQFFLAPYPVNGSPNQGNPALAPDVTTNSWACPPSEGCSFQSLLLAVQAQRAAGILTVAAAGNSGSQGCGSVQDPPAIYDQVYTVGALNSNSGNIAGFSSRGPVTVDGSNRMKPDITAPGTGIRSSIRFSTYQGGWNGTSMATPHVAGAVALLYAAHPALKGHPSITEQVLNDTAVPVAVSSCSSSGVPNNVYGHGRLDVLAAVMAVRGGSLSAASAQQAAAAGTPVVYSLTVTNTGYLPDGFSLSAGPSSFPVTILNPQPGPLLAGASSPVDVVVQIPPASLPGNTDSVTINLVSVNFALATNSISLQTTVSVSGPTLSLTQPGGPGTPLFVQDGNLAPGQEYFNVFSLESCPSGLGQGIFLGLCATDPNLLFLQLALPLGLEPSHFLAPGPGVLFGPYGVPAGLLIQGICLGLNGSGFNGVSAVSQLVTL